VEGPYGKAIQITERSENWYSIEVSNLSSDGFYDFDANEYEIVVHGRNISGSDFTMNISACGNPWEGQWDTLYSTDVPAGHEFTLSGILSGEIFDATPDGRDQFQWGVRLHTDCTNPYIIYDVIITKK
jgi:hypothetical protein